MHLAAEQNFLHVTKSLVERYPGLMYLWTYEQDDKPSYLPVELALKKYKDETAAYLISQMRHDRWVLLGMCSPPTPPLWKFQVSFNISSNVLVLQNPSPPR